VDVYDKAFSPVKLSAPPSDSGCFDDDVRSSGNPFEDESPPPGYVPFKQGSPFETDGPGLGFVDLYNSAGRLLRRLAHGDWLNAPWGVALAPLDFGRFTHDLLIGQFAGGGETQSSGFIAAYDLATGKFDALLQDTSGKPLAINGIWDLALETSARPIAMRRRHLPQRCTSPVARTTAPTDCLVF
jgi:uncharacterized protein (TIGR03118 family)